MINYNYIRVDRSLVVPATSVFNDDGEFINILCPGFEKPFSCGGEIAEGLRTWLEGTRTFRVTPNGVLDLYGSLVQNLQAQQVFNGVTHPQQKSVDNLMNPSNNVSDVILDAETLNPRSGAPATFDPPKPPDSLNIDAIARGIKKRRSYE